ncbi:MAG: hypothetical protein AB1489_08070 [Acidobacteriota bacterium]
MKLPVYSRIEYNGKILNTAQIARLQTLFTTLQHTEYKFYEKPEIIITAYREGSNEPDYYSVFLQDNLIYAGYFLTAWEDRMHDKASSCYRLDGETKQFLIDLGKQD